MRREDKEKREEKMLDDLQYKQSNIIWPDALINSRGVDNFLWNGSPKPTRVQSAAAIIFGLFFLLAALAFSGIAAKCHSFLVAIFAVAWLYIGARVMYNGIPRTARRK